MGHPLSLTESSAILPITKQQFFVNNNDFAHKFPPLNNLLFVATTNFLHTLQTFPIKIPNHQRQTYWNLPNLSTTQHYNTINYM